MALHSRRRILLVSLQLLLMPKCVSMLAIALVVAGCFNEPVPAYKTVPAENRVYLNDRALKVIPKINLNADYLNLDRNELKDVSGIENLTELKWLRLNSNQLSALPNLKRLTKLRRIYLKRNYFAEVPDTLRDLPSLTDIELSDNPIREVPKWLAEKKGLKNLSFNRTLITRLPDDISAWASLNSLQLGDLQLSAEEMARIRSALPKSVAVVF